MALAGWLLARRALPRVWPDAPAESFAKPWRELGFALLGAVGILAVGQLWSRGLRLPETGALAPVLAAVNQLLIFAPILLVPVLRRQSWSTAWLPRGALMQRVLVGLALASAAVAAYSSLRAGAGAPWTVLGRIGRFDHLDEFVQVLLEDVTIAILFVRLAAAIGKGGSVVVVAILFAVGHVPAMLSEGAGAHELFGLLGDVALGIAVLLVLRRSRDVVWFCFVHFVLDMTQFARVSGVE